MEITKGSEMEMLEVKNCNIRKNTSDELISKNGANYLILLLSQTQLGVLGFVLLLYFMLGGYRTFKRL